MIHKMHASWFFLTGFLTCLIFLPVHSHNIYCFSKTFHDPQFNFRTFQDWKMKFLNSMKHQVFHVSMTRKNPVSEVGGGGGKKIFCGTPQHTFWGRWWCRCLSGRGGHWLSTTLRGFPFKFFRSLTQIFRFFSFFFLLRFLFFAGRFIADFLPWFCLD